MKDKIALNLIRFRSYIVALYILITLVMMWFALGTSIESGYYRLLPVDNPITNVYFKHLSEFGGGDKVLIAVTANKGTIYTPEFLKVLKAINEDCYYLEGFDRAKASSLFTPNTTYIEVVEGGFKGGGVTDGTSSMTPEQVEKIRSNVEKAKIVGSLVANDYSSAMIQLERLEIDRSLQATL